MPSRRALARRASIVAALWAVPAQAGPLVIAPTTVEMAPAARAAVIEVTNNGPEEADLQFRAFSWSQAEGGRDMLTSTDELIVSPAIVTVKPGGRQVFRILRAGGGSDPASTGERSYRLKLNELPRYSGGAVAISLEFSIPVFVTRPGAAPTIDWTSDGRTATVTNHGDRRLRLGKLSIAGPGGAADLIGAPSAYLLAGSSRSFTLSAAVRPGGTERLAGLSDRGPVDVPSRALAAR